MANDLIPELRFTEFEGVSNYIKFIFNDIFIFSTGKNIKQKEASPDFEIPCVRYGELYHMYNEVISEIFNKTNLDKSELLFSNGDEILLPSAGEDPLDIGSASALTLSNVAIGRTINILRPKEDNIYSQIYVSYYINQKLRKKISTLAKGVSISNVYNSDLKKLTIILPTPTEQTKIATFLTAVDKRINLLQKKKAELEQYKKGVMQKLFSQTLRFKKEDGSDFEDWEEKKLGEVFEVTRGNVLAVKMVKLKPVDDYIYPVYSSQTKNNGLMGFYNEYLYQDAITWTTDGANAGGTNYRKGKFYCTNVSGVLINKKGNANQCIAEMLNRITKRYVSYVGNPKLMNNVMENIKIAFPSIDEQQKIAKFLSSIDKSIENLQFTINNSQLFKKGLLQKMFV